MAKNTNTLIAFDEDSSKEYQLAEKNGTGYAWDPKIVRRTVDVELSVTPQEAATLSQALQQTALSDTDASGATTDGAKSDAPNIDTPNVDMSGIGMPNIDIQKTSDGFMFMSVGDKTYQVEIVSCKQNEYEVLVNGVSYSFSIETGFSLRRRKMLEALAAQSSSVTLKAPIPGVVIEVLVKPGDVVKAGDTLIILEAMKMQNAILASAKGTVTRILVSAGDSVNQRDVLIELGKE